MLYELADAIETGISDGSRLVDGWGFPEEVRGQAQLLSVVQRIVPALRGLPPPPELPPAEEIRKLLGRG
jgi:hypothetical protein